MESLFPALVAVAAITLTYFMCLRPMRRGKCMITPRQDAGQADSERDSEIARLRAEVADLRRDLDPSRSHSETTPGAVGADSESSR